MQVEGIILAVAAWHSTIVQPTNHILASENASYTALLAPVRSKRVKLFGVLARYSWMLLLWILQHKERVTTFLNFIYLFISPPMKLGEFLFFYLTYWGYHLSFAKFSIKCTHSLNSNLFKVVVNVYRMLWLNILYRILRAVKCWRWIVKI